jgi:hypothetical protein
MSAESRVLALRWARQDMVPYGTALPPERAGDVTATAQVYYRWLEGPAFLFLSVSPLTFPQDAPDGPGVPTVMKGNAMAQITDAQQYTASVGEVDSKNQPVTGDNLAWVIADPTVASVTPSADGYSAVIAGVADGTTTYTVTDSTVSPPLTGTGSVTVVSGAATSLTITEGTPEDQPSAAPPAS